MDAVDHLLGSALGGTAFQKPKTVAVPSVEGWLVIHAPLPAFVGAVASQDQVQGQLLVQAGVPVITGEGSMAEVALTNWLLGLEDFPP